MDLSVEVRSHDIIVSQPGTGLCMTYRRDPNSPMLEALCSMRSDPDAETLRFLTEAWKAAHANEGARLASIACLQRPTNFSRLAPDSHIQKE
jgi:hypothetical protein